MILATSFYKRCWELTISVLFPYPRWDQILTLRVSAYIFECPVIIEAEPWTPGYYGEVRTPSCHTESCSFLLSSYCFDSDLSPYATGFLPQVPCTMFSSYCCNSGLSSSLPGSYRVFCT